MVSPNSCLQVLSLGGTGESSGGSAHLQVATSTTPEATSGAHRHNFLLNVHSSRIGASPPSHMKQDIGGVSEYSCCVLHEHNYVYSCEENCNSLISSFISC